MSSGFLTKLAAAKANIEGFVSREHARGVWGVTTRRPLRSDDYGNIRSDALCPIPIETTPHR
jgi:hypothetical protein